MQEGHVEDWLRMQRELLAAERAFSERLRLYAEGSISAQELAESKERVEAARELADAVTARVASPTGTTVVATR
jgi:hypothetical protein